MVTSIDERASDLLFQQQQHSSIKGTYGSVLYSPIYEDPRLFHPVAPPLRPRARPRLFLFLLAFFTVPPPTLPLSFLPTSISHLFPSPSQRTGFTHGLSQVEPTLTLNTHLHGTNIPSLYILQTSTASLHHLFARSENHPPTMHSTTVASFVLALAAALQASAFHVESGTSCSSVGSACSCECLCFVVHILLCHPFFWPPPPTPTPPPPSLPTADASCAGPSRACRHHISKETKKRGGTKVV